MKNTLKRTLAILLAMVMTIGIAPLSGFVGFDLSESFGFAVEAEAKTYSGDCGDNLTWSLDEETGLLNISGTGDMYDYNDRTVPWLYERSLIKTINVENGVAGISSYAFSLLENPVSISIPDSVTHIGDFAFYGCKNLKTVSIGNGVAVIGSQIFVNCINLTTVIIGGGVASLNAEIFNGCDNLSEVYFNGTKSSWNAIKAGSSSPLDNATIYCLGENGAVVSSGFCGNELTWVLYENGLLEFIGNGEMSTYTSETEIPWYSLRESIKAVEFSDGMTGISDYAFVECINLKLIEIPDNIVHIGANAFAGTINLEYFRMPMISGCKSLFMSGVGRSASEISIENGEIIINWIKGDETTVINLGKDLNSFDHFMAVKGACGLIEEIKLSEANTDFKLIDGVLYDKDISTLHLYPTASYKKTYVMPDTVKSDGKKISTDSMEDLLALFTPDPTVLSSAKYLENVTWGASYSPSWFNLLLDYNALDEYLKQADTATDIAEKESALVIITAVIGTYATLYNLGGTGYKNLKEFNVSKKNPYFSGEFGMLCYKYYDYNLFIQPIVKNIDVVELSENYILAPTSFLKAKIDEVIINDDYAVNLLKTLEKSEEERDYNFYTSLSAYFVPCAKVGKYTVSGTNKYVASVDDVLFSKDGKALLLYPTGSEAELYMVPDVDYISECAFGLAGEAVPGGNPNLTLHISDELMEKLLEGGKYEYMQIPLGLGAGTLCFEEKYLDEVEGLSDTEGYLEIFNAQLRAQKEQYEASQKAKIEGVEESYKAGLISEFYCDYMMETYKETADTIVTYAYLKPCKGHGADGHEHSYTSEVSKESTCTEEGVEKFTCFCGESYTKTILMKEHNIVVDDEVEATCTEAGFTKGEHCSLCGEVFLEQEKIDALGHEFGEWICIKEPTFTEAGIRTRKCEYCDVEETESVPEIEFDVLNLRTENATVNSMDKMIILTALDGATKISVYPTTKDGKDVVIETDGTPIKKSKSGTYYLNFADWHKNGNITETTMTIDETTVNVIFVFKVKDDGHEEVSFEDVKPTCTQDGKAGGIYCSVCGEIIVEQKVIRATGHSYSEWEVTVEPTLTELGKKERTCSICNATEEVTIPATGIMVTVTDSEGEVVKEEIISGDMTELKLSGLAEGEYTLTFSKKNYITRDYLVSATDGDISMEFKLFLNGDVTGDGKVNTVDVARVNSHAKKVSLLSDYPLDCADVNGDGKVNTVDVARINSHAKNVSLLW